MKTFTVEGNGWSIDIDVNEANYEKYKDMAAEAMTQALEILMEEEEAAFGFVIMAYEKGFKEDPNKVIACMTTHVLRNAGFYSLADEADKEIKRAIHDLPDENDL
jgi:hypothetical protein